MLTQYFPERATGNTKATVAWTQSPDQIRKEFGVDLIGWPTGSVFRDLSNLRMWELRVLMGRVDKGTCCFQPLDMCEHLKPVAHVRKKIVTKQEGGRRDKATCRGRQAHPAKPRKKGKIGKVFHPLPSGFGELEEDPIEEAD